MRSTQKQRIAAPWRGLIDCRGRLRRSTFKIAVVMEAKRSDSIIEIHTERDIETLGYLLL
jgi:hypothetical protein